MLKNWMLNRLRGEVKKVTGIEVPTNDNLVSLAGLKQVVIPSSLVFYQGKPIVRQYFAVQDQTIATKQQVLFLAASMVQKGQHSILQSLLHAAKESGIVTREADMDTVEEMGSIGRLDRTMYVLGDEKMMAQQEIELGVTVQTLAHQFELDGKYTLFLAQRHPKRLLAIFACEYELKPGCADVITELRQLGVESILLTGVKTRIAKGLGNRLSVSLIHSELSEQEKDRVVSGLVHQQPASAILLGEDSRQSYPSQLTIGVEGQKGTITIPTLAELPLLMKSVQRGISEIRSKLPFSKL